MKELKSLYRFAEKKNIPIIPFSLPETGSMALETEDGKYYIGMDMTVLETESRERTHLAHELGHCVTGSFYNRYAAIEYRQKHENRADRWAIRRLVSESALDAAVADGITECWDLAEHFGVSEDFIRKAVCLYTYGNLAVDTYI